MSFFQSQEHYTVTIHDGDDEAEVTLRPLNAGDTAKIQDTLALSPEGDVGIKIGTVRMMTIKAAIVKWTLPGPVTEQTLKQLKPKVLDEIFEAIQADGTEDDSPLEEPSLATS